MTNRPQNPRDRNAGEQFIQNWTAEAARLSAGGLYDPADEHASCGVGMVVAIDGKPRREPGMFALSRR